VSCSSQNTRSCRHPRLGSVSRSHNERLNYNTHVDAYPDRKYRIGRIPLSEASRLRTLQIQVDLINEREHSRSERRDELGVSCCAATRKVVRIYRAGVELRNVVAYPIWASRSSIAWEGWVPERVGWGCEGKSRVEAGL
jgi:hypothetical protein